jgi:hypothetical protein
MIIWVVWDMTPCSLLPNILKLWNFRKHSTSVTASHPRRPKSSEATLSNTEGILHIQCTVFLWHFDLFLGHGLLLRGFVNTLIGHTTLCRTPLDKWSAQHRGLYLTAHKKFTRDKHPCPPVGFEPTIPADKWLQAYALNCRATAIKIKCTADLKVCALKLHY